MKNKDKLIFNIILKHFNEMSEVINLINDDFETFDSNIIYQKAIKMDLFQIGELFNTFSEDVKNHFDKRDIRGIIDVRNFIAHGYIVINNRAIWNDIHNDLPRLIGQLRLLFE